MKRDLFARNPGYRGTVLKERKTLEDQELLDAVDEGMTIDQAANKVDKAARRRLTREGLTKLPIDRRGCTEALEQEGFVFTGKCEGIFERVEAPDGWRLEPTDHSMWSTLFDPAGNKRGSMFYKAAPWDTSAHLSLLTRYTASFNPNPERCPHPWNTPERDAYEAGSECVKDALTGEQIWEGAVLTNAEKDALYMSEDPGTARGWLKEHYPDWQNPAAYWGQE